jgi:4-aminobutyrate aminotransferase-like enzyme
MTDRPPGPTNTGAEILRARRTEALGPTYTLFYDEPLHIVRAEGVWMYDAEGRKYLDAYNNVPVVGHCHPYVVDALIHQARTLNTHTRYLAEQPLALADRLLATLPPELGNVVFTCTGSEANDLAVRISKAVTGGTGFIITDYAYHGTTDVIAGMSPEDGRPLGPGVYPVPAPLGPEGGARFGESVRQCIQVMRWAGIRPAALLVDTIFSSDGVVADPAGFLAPAVNEVRAAGGLFIADEVQPGFGRTGEHMWGFQRHGVVPDLVTMGKPMGNGHPISAVVARPSLLQSFARESRYFNTFGGNSVSCAVALAVLDVIEREHIMHNARASGGHLRQGLLNLAQRFPWIREIRGAGLFMGAELAAHPTTGLSPAQEASRIVNDLRRHGVLVGTTGRNNNVLKIRPPLTIGRDEVDLLLTALDRSLAV